MCHHELCRLWLHGLYGLHELRCLLFTHSNENDSILTLNFTKVCSPGSVDHQCWLTGLAIITWTKLAWHITGNKPLTEPMFTKVVDTIIARPQRWHISPLQYSWYKSFWILSRNYSYPTFYINMSSHQTGMINKFQGHQKGTLRWEQNGPHFADNILNLFSQQKIIIFWSNLPESCDKISQQNWVMMTLGTWN